MLQLKILKGPDGGDVKVGAQFPIRSGQPVVIGRGADCDVKLGAAGVSKRHARLTAIAGSKVEVEDMGSANGTFVNGFLVKKHVLRPGDTLVIHPFVFQVDVTAPDPVSNGGGGGFGNPQGFGQNAFAQDAEIVTPSAPANEGSSSVVGGFLESNVYPLADNLSGRFDVRFLVTIFFLLWSLLIVLFTAMPFSESANSKVVNESIEVAKLYVRQLVRLNQQAILDQRYRDLVAELDARRGQTPRIMKSMILDAAKAQILSPTELLGRPVPDNYAANALTYSDLHVQMTKDGIAYVSAPIKFHDSEKNVDAIAAVALVEYDAASARFTLANILDQAVSSFLYALLATILFMVFVYRWTEGSVESVILKMDEALKRNEIQITAPVKWPVVAQLAEQISVVLGRASSGGGAEVVGGSRDWAIVSVGASGSAAAAFDQGLQVLAWNEGMEKVIGIRATMAIGGDISAASRDVAFEANVRELAGQAAAQPGQAVSTGLDFSGRPHKLRMVFADGAFFLTIVEET